MKKLNSRLKFIILMISGFIGLITMFILSLYFGAEKSITIIMMIILMKLLLEILDCRDLLQMF